VTLTLITQYLLEHEFQSGVERAASRDNPCSRSRCSSPRPNFYVTKSKWVLQEHRTA